jgi:hypothetical protein
MNIETGPPRAAKNGEGQMKRITFFGSLITLKALVVATKFRIDLVMPMLTA